jgi:hypothetical protein
MVMPELKIQKVEKGVDANEIYSSIETTKLNITLCINCYGCGLLELATFSGLKECNNYINAKRGRR